MANYTSAQKNAAAAAARSAMGGGSGYKKVVGLPYMQDIPVAARAAAANKSQSMPAASPASPIAGRYSTSNLSYPLNVEDDPQQGHHIIFEINQVDKGKMEANKIERRRQAMVKMLTAGGDPEAGGVQGMSQKVIKDASKNATGGKKMRSLTMKKRPTKRTSGFIALYMPAAVKVQYAADYGEEEIGILAETGAGIIEGLMQGRPGGETAMKALGGLETGVKQAAVAALEAIAPGAKAIMALNEGKVITPKMELMFKGIGRRDFSFEFSFLPKSEQEAIVVESIIHKFKFHMASNYTTGAEGVRKMDIPDNFNIRYMYHNAENLHLNKISTCVLKGMDVEYGGDRFVAYGDGRPQATKISLTFQELEIITKDDIALGY